MHRISVKKGRERSIKSKHPWVFSGSIEPADYAISPGSIVKLVDHSGTFLAYGIYSPASTIRVRILSWVETVKPDADWISSRIIHAIAQRTKRDLSRDTDAYRLVYSEGDYLPGLIVDRYGEYVVFQILTVGMESFRSVIIDTLQQELAPRSLYEKSIGPGRSREGLPERVELVMGMELSELTRIVEYGCSYLVDIKDGHKTGFYLDQRDSRLTVSQKAVGARVLNCFSYTGGFGIAAASAGAREVVHVDSSSKVLKIAEQAVAENTQQTSHTYLEEDVFGYLRKLVADGEVFDLVVLDPPKLAARKKDINKAARAYKDMNRLAMQLLDVGGVLATFSCSGAMDTKLFGQIVWEASVEAKADFQMIQSFGQPLDHPVLLSFPEGSYLKGFLLERTGTPLH